MRLYRLHKKGDTQIPPAIVDSGNIVVVENDNLDDEADVLGMLSTCTTFLDPRYNLLGLLTPTTTQNRQSYLGELVLNKPQKQISNKAVHACLRKDAAAFRVEDMPTNVRGFARYLGVRTIEDVRRHRCGNSECSYAWIGAVAPYKYNSEEVCLDCGTPRYKRVGSVLKP